MSDSGKKVILGNFEMVKLPTGDVAITYVGEEKQRQLYGKIVIGRTLDEDGIAISNPSDPLFSKIKVLRAALDLLESEETTCEECQYVLAEKDPATPSRSYCQLFNCFVDELEDGCLKDLPIEEIVKRCSRYDPEKCHVRKIDDLLQCKDKDFQIKKP